MFKARTLLQPRIPRSSWVVGVPKLLRRPTAQQVIRATLNERPNWPGRGGKKTGPQTGGKDDKATSSPAELMGEITACRDLRSLDRVIADHGQRFDYRKVSAAMNKVAKLQRNQVAMAHRMMQDLSVLALHECSHAVQCVVGFGQSRRPGQPYSSTGYLSAYQRKVGQLQRP